MKVGATSYQHTCLLFVIVCRCAFHISWLTVLVDKRRRTVDTISFKRIGVEKIKEFEMSATKFADRVGEKIGGGDAQLKDGHEKGTRCRMGSGSNRIPVEVVAQFRNISNLTQLELITLNNVLDCLVERFRSKIYYTFAGSVLISLNPCLNVSRRKSLNTVESRLKYSVTEDNADVDLPPHVYSLGMKSLKNLRLTGTSQVIIVSGDSGAGKTTATQQLIDYFTKTKIHEGPSDINGVIALERKIYLATVVLESFGNASTTANPNSSRFGRLVELKYDQSKSIVGAEIKTYLLEKHRVAKFGQKERNFHIFYQLLKALENQKISMESLTDVCCEDGLSTSLVNAMLDSDDECFDNLLDAVSKLQLDKFFIEICRVIFGLMHLMNVRFIEEENKENCEDYSPSVNQEFSLMAEDKERVKVACSILGFKEDTLIDSFISQKLTLGQNKRHSIYRKLCKSVDECESRIKTFVTFLYNHLFNHILSHLNTLIHINSNDKQTISTTLSLLDLYGFENLQINHLEQMCINYANERLQQLQISTLKKYFTEERICADLLFKQGPQELNRVQLEIESRIEDVHVHIFSILDEECLLGRCHSDSHVFERIRMSVVEKKSKYIGVTPVHKEDCPFTIKHYATEVSYCMKGMPEKNKDYVPPEFSEILRTSSNELVQSLLPPSVLNQTPRKNADRGKTILTGFKNSVAALLNELNDSENQDMHFVRCVRPNGDLLEGKIEPEIVKSQLYACGIVDVIRIAGNGLPIRTTPSKLKKEFRNVLSRFGEDDIRKSVEALRLNPVQFGKAMIFMSEDVWKFLVKLELLIKKSAVTILQRSWTRLIERRNETINITVRTPSPLSSSDSTQYFTPRNNTTFSDSGDSFISSTPKTLVSYNLATSLPYDSDISDDLGSIISSLELTFQDDGVLKESESRCGEVHNENSKTPKSKRPYPKMMVHGDGIVSRSAVHSMPIKIYVRQTTLGFAHKQPRRLIANGIEDALADYGIIVWDN